MKRLMTVCAAAVAITAYAQQTMYESNLLSRARFAAGNVDSAEALTDGNDMTTARLRGDRSVEYRFDNPVVVTGVNILAADNLGLAPAAVSMYARNSDAENWTPVIVNAATDYLLPYTNAVVAADNEAPYKFFKIVVDKVADGGDAASVAELQLLGRNPAAAIYPAKTETVAATMEPVDLGVIGDHTRVAILNYNLDSPLVVNGYTLGACALTDGTSQPVAWEFQASNDGENWLTLDMQSNMPVVPPGNSAIEYRFDRIGRNIDFTDALDRIHDMADKKFYRDYTDGKYLIHAWNSDSARINRGYNYWWMAHAVDAYVDAYRRTGNPVYENHAREIRKGMYIAYDASRRDLWNSFFDDMDWMCLACLRASETLSEAPDEWLGEARQLFDWIWDEGWDPTTGGILWTHNSAKGTVDSKNSCSNAPSMLCAALLYQRTGDTQYLEKAEKIYDFMVAHNLFADGFVKDSPAQDNRGWAFTYNQGTWAGGLLELYKATGRQEYYDRAVDLIDKSIDSRWYSPAGIMRESGKDDGGLFKGIFIRYITDWVLSGLLDSERRMRYAAYLVNNARSLYLGALVKPSMTIMANWQDRSEAHLADYHASVVLSGLFLLESIERLREAGLLAADYSLVNPNRGKPYSRYRLKVTATSPAEAPSVNLSAFNLLID